MWMNYDEFYLSNLSLGRTSPLRGMIHQVVCHPNLLVCLHKVQLAALEFSPVENQNMSRFHSSIFRTQCLTPIT